MKEVMKIFEPIQLYYDHMEPTEIMSTIDHLIDSFGNRYELSRPPIWYRQTLKKGSVVATLSRYPKQSAKIVYENSSQPSTDENLIYFENKNHKALLPLTINPKPLFYETEKNVLYRVDKILHNDKPKGNAQFYFGKNIKNIYLNFL